MKQHLPVMYVIVAGFILTGCQSIEISRWSGSWVDERSSDHGGDLRCISRRLDETNWQATFSGFCGREFGYDIEMHGRQDDSAVKFDGEVDLGEEDGGVYTWTGVMQGNYFDGEYATRTGKAGSFAMVRY